MELGTYFSNGFWMGAIGIMMIIFLIWIVIVIFDSFKNGASPIRPLIGTICTGIAYYHLGTDSMFISWIQAHIFWAIITGTFMNFVLLMGSQDLTWIAIKEMNQGKEPDGKVALATISFVMMIIGTAWIFFVGPTMDFFQVF